MSQQSDDFAASVSSIMIANVESLGVCVMIATRVSMPFIFD